MSKLELSLIENAKSFLSESLENAIDAESNPLKWKFATLHLVQSIELSLKELLRQQHAFFIYENIDKPKKTVGLELALNRLQKLCGFSLTTEERQALKLASSIRNEIVHYECSVETKNLKLAFAKLFGFLSDFYQEHFEYYPDEFIEKTLFSKGVQIKEYGEELFKRAKKKLETEGLIDTCIVCPSCGWEAMTAYGDKEDTCYVCGNIEHLVVCDRCGKTMLSGEEHESSGKEYCWDCIEYWSDDYWYESSVGK
jgi:hypothetical protein